MKLYIITNFLGKFENGKFEYISQCTGEVYANVPHMVVSIVADMIHYPACRTWKMFNVKKEVRG